MSTDTTTINKQRTGFDQQKSLWLFGYGSLIFRADFPYLERRPASICHWSRRFWQGSHDHRGTEDSPGRVVTLVPEQDARCDGMAYLITPSVLEHLDFREKNGYLRFEAELTFENGESSLSLVYIATADNEAYLGPASDQIIARHIADSAGPSGTNRDYVLELARALRQQSAEDAHVFAIAKILTEAGD